MGKGSFTGGFLVGRLASLSLSKGQEFRGSLPPRILNFLGVGLAPGGNALVIKPLHRPDAFFTSYCSGASTTQYLKFDEFDLRSTLKDDNAARLEVEVLGFSLEDEEGCLLACAASSPSVISLKAGSLPSNAPSVSHHCLPSNFQPGSSKKAKKAAAQERQANGELKGHAVRIAQDAMPIELKSFDTSLLPIASNRWTAYSRTKLSPGLQRLWRDLDADMLTLG
ncbi:hypothetical protein C8J55DRAFT_492192 [Lentinula edodes]|uniref:Uncharacterized protein n=1 Tax=Lentinula lateritia TaxID=40482 RepID=A0A9W8ZXD2_9AGAR|nr:hypothetical protein C8J55DRAFT_492192 [Lentinula edodes]